MRANSLISGILNLIIGLMWIVVGTVDNSVTLVIGSLVIVSGIILIMYSKNPIYELIKKKNTILTFAILLLPFNLISSIILFVEYDLVKRDYHKYLAFNNIQEVEQIKQKNEVSKELKKVDVLIKIGLAMILVAGVMIVTTSWESITNVVKLGLLVIIGILFLGLYKFSDMKLKIRNTTIAYWLLSMIAFVLGAFLVGYGQLLGEWFSLDGYGSAVYISTFLLVVSGLSFLTYKRFSINQFLYLTYTTIVLAVASIIQYLGQEPRICELGIALILLVINVLPKSDKKEILIVKNFSMVVTYILTAILITELSDINGNLIILATLIIQIASLVSLTIREKNDVINVLSSIAIIALTSISISNMLVNVDEIVRLIITRTIFLVLAMIIGLVIIKDSKLSNILLSIVFSVVLLSVITEVNIAIAVFVGIVALTMIIWGFISKDYKAIYIEGIVFTVINLLIQLSEFWGELPIWVYLLLGGFLLIGIVTVKELKKTNDEQK